MNQFSREFWVSGPLFCDILVSWSHFFVIFWVLGRVWRLGGSLGGSKCPNMVRDTLSLDTFWLHFGALLWENSCYFSCSFLYMCLDVFFYDFWWFWKRFWELFGSIFDNFLKTAILWKIAPRLGESTIFKVLEGLETLLFCYFFGYGFWMASGMDFLWFMGGFEIRFGSPNQ